MLIYLLFALMTGLAVMAVLLPLARQRPATAPASHDIAVYRDQLLELEQDRRRGLIDAAEAEAARAEIARRLLKASAMAETQTAEASTQTGRRRLASLLALIGIPIVALGTYAALGSPALPDQPLAQRREAPSGGPPQMADLLARIERRLAEDPRDGRGWDVVAPVYARLGRWADAINAYRQAIALLGSTAERQAGLGDSLVAEAGGMITAEAQSVFRIVLAQEPSDPRARFYLALAQSQDGDAAGARAALSALLADTPADAPWRAFVVQELQRLGGSVPEGAPRPAAAPSADAPDPRAMVARLAERLVAEPDNPEGWLRLVRSYAVLGDAEAARRAGLEGARALAHRPEAAQALAQLLAELGLGPRP